MHGDPRLGVPSDNMWIHVGKCTPVFAQLVSKRSMPIGATARCIAFISVVDTNQLVVTLHACDEAHRKGIVYHTGVRTGSSALVVCTQG